MRIASGKVIGGKVVVEGPALPEGQVVTILAREGEETFEVSPDQEAELLASLDEADRGDVLSSETVLERARRPK